MLLADMRKMQTTIEKAFRESVERTFEYLIMSSLTPGIFNLGGDLGLFREKIEVRDEAALRLYAYHCVAAVFSHYCGFEHRVTTIALIQGDALGGGFEAALASDILVAERQSQMGFPEILFNLFPGMGAYSFLCRRIGVAKTEEMLRTGNIYSAAQLYDLGVVDMLVEPGEGENAVRELIRKNKPRQNALSALYQVRRRVNPITLEELEDIADIWVAAALRLGESDLRRMSRITAAQDKARARCVAEATVAN
jgi:DSF synthase